MIYCVKCGAENDENLNFCQNCGQQLAINNPPANVNNGYNPYKGRAIASMVLGIVSCALWWGYGITGLIPGIIGLVFAIGLKKNQEAYDKNKGFVTAGYICSLIGVILSGLVLLIFLVVCVCAVACIGSGGYYY